MSLNLLNPKRSNIPKKDVSRPGNERERRIMQGIQSAGDPDAKKVGIAQALWHSTLFLAVVAIAIASVYYWQAWRKKRAEWEVNDPMALVKELNFVHQLAEPEKRLMQEIARKNAMSSPLKLFVEPKYFLAAWDDNSLRSSRSSVRLLLSKLFGITTEIGETTTALGSNSGTIVYPSKIRNEGE